MDPLCSAGQGGQRGTRLHWQQRIFGWLVMEWGVG